MAQAPVSLKNLLVPSKSLEAEFPGMDGFVVSLAFLSRETLINIRKKASKQTFKNRQVMEELDDKLFLKLYVEAAIKGWKGLKFKYLNELAPVDISALNAEDELPFSTEDALFLMQASTAFDSFVSETVTELGNFTSNNTAK